MPSDRTKQVQFRMPEELHTELKATLAREKSSFTDFFNKAAEEYLQNSVAEMKKVKSGGRKNGNGKN